MYHCRDTRKRDECARSCLHLVASQHYYNKNATAAKLEELGQDPQSYLGSKLPWHPNTHENKGLTPIAEIGRGGSGLFLLQILCFSTDLSPPHVLSPLLEVPLGWAKREAWGVTVQPPKSQA